VNRVFPNPSNDNLAESAAKISEEKSSSSSQDHLKAFQKFIDKQRNNPNPETIYRGIGVELNAIDIIYDDIGKNGETGQVTKKNVALRIEEIFSPEVERFYEIVKNSEGGREKKLSQLKKGAMITHLYLKTDDGEKKFVEVKEIFDMFNGDSKKAEEFIASFFHQNDVINFKVADDSFPEGKSTVYECDNRINETAFFGATDVEDGKGKNFQCFSKTIKNNPKKAIEIMDKFLGLSNEAARPDSASTENARPNSPSDINIILKEKPTGNEEPKGKGSPSIVSTVVGRSFPPTPITSLPASPLQNGLDGKNLSDELMSLETTDSNKPSSVMSPKKQKGKVGETGFFNRVFDSCFGRKP